MKKMKLIILLPPGGFSAMNQFHILTVEERYNTQKHYMLEKP